MKPTILMVPTKNMSPFACGASQLSALGFHVLPLTARSKAIKIGGWTRYAATRPTEAEIAMWSLWKDANIGAAMGSPAGDGTILVAVDIDVADRDDVDRIKSALPRSPMAKLGKKGETLFFRAPIGTATYVWRRDAKTMIVELLSKGRQTVLPHSIHPETTRAYQWTAGPVPVADLPLLDADDLVCLQEAADAFRGVSPLVAAAPLQIAVSEPPVAVTDHGDDASPVTVMNRRMNDTALANLDAWVGSLGLPKLRRHPNGAWEAVADWRSSSTGRPLEAREPHLRFHSTGIVDFGDGNRGYSATDVVQRALDRDHDDAFRWLSERVHAFPETADMPTPDELDASERRKRKERGEPVPLRVIEHAGGMLSDEETGEVIPTVIRKADRELPDHLTHVPGLLGDVVDWIEATARRPNRVLSLGAAIATIGTLAGRRDATPTRSGLQLYVLGLARSGAGKQHGLDAAYKLMDAAGAERHIASSEAMSQTALIAELKHEPLALSLADEIGAFLNRINALKAGAHDLGIKKVLRSVWGTNFGTYKTPSFAAALPTSLHSPSFSLYGVSTPVEFYAALKGNDVINGMLNRFLLLSTDVRAPEVKPAKDFNVVPYDLADRLIELFEARDRHAFRNPELNVVPRVIPWGERAEAIYDALSAECRRREDDDSALQPHLARTTEMAVRLATIRAVACNLENPIVEAADMEWGRDLAVWSAERMAEEAGDLIADTDRGRMWATTIRKLRESPDGRLDKSALQNAIGSKFSESNEAINELVQMGRVAVLDVKPTRGPSKKVIALLEKKTLH